MISLYSGTPGSGKSCHAAREIALRLQRKDSVVIGNFYFNTKAVKNVKVYTFMSRTIAWIRTNCSDSHAGYQSISAAGSGKEKLRST